MDVRELPPNEFRSSLVRVEERKGTNPDGFAAERTEARCDVVSIQTDETKPGCHTCQSFDDVTKGEERNVDALHFFYPLRVNSYQARPLCNNVGQLHTQEEEVGQRIQSHSSIREAVPFPSPRDRRDTGLMCV